MLPTFLACEEVLHALPSNLVCMLSSCLKGGLPEHRQDKGSSPTTNGSWTRQLVCADGVQEGMPGQPVPHTAVSFLDLHHGNMADGPKKEVQYDEYQRQEARCVCAAPRACTPGERFLEGGHGEQRGQGGSGQGRGYNKIGNEGIGTVFKEVSFEKRCGWDLA